MPRASTSWLSWFLLLFVALSVPTRASTTLMVLVDWWYPLPMDTVIDLKVFQPTLGIERVDGSAVPNPVATKAYTTERFSWWYALPNFNANDYVQGRIRFDITYSRGWFQNDSSYRASAGDTIFFPDTQKTLTYMSTRTGVIATVILPATAPKFFVFPEVASYRGPKLYSVMDVASTGILNKRTLGVDYMPDSGSGLLDKCIDSLKSDTVWIRWGTPSAPPGQQPSASGMKCFRNNPFVTPTTSIRTPIRSSRPSDRVDLVIDRNPRVQPGGQWDLSGRKQLR